MADYSYRQLMLMLPPLIRRQADIRLIDAATLAAFLRRRLRRPLPELMLPLSFYGRWSRCFLARMLLRWPL